MKIAISNLAFGKSDFFDVLPRIANFELDGIEIAPSLLWQNFDSTSVSDFKSFQSKFIKNNVKVSGIQSLLFGHPEFQVFDKSTWPSMVNRMNHMFEFAAIVGAEVAVFGSPKNRVRGSLSTENADNIFLDFLEMLRPRLQDNNIVLTLEPNAPEYGADYLTTYSDVVRITEQFQSKYVRPQIDTGCLMMVNEDICESFKSYMPKHIHLSVPYLTPLPGIFDFDNFLAELATSKYSGWLVLEMLLDSKEAHAIPSTLQWLKERIGRIELV